MSVPASPSPPADPADSLPQPTRRPARRQRPPELGLFLVVLGLAALLGLFGGSVERPRFETGPDGARQRVYVTTPDGDEVPARERVNKFFNVRTLTQLAKDTSFVAIMAIGMTFVIIAGQIDLSVGATYALSAVTAALVLHHYGPDGTGQPHLGTWLGSAACLGTGAACGLANGLMVTRLRVHPFIITLGTMAIFRGIAFVRTGGQSVGSFPEPFRTTIAWQTPGELSLGPLIATALVAGAAALYLARHAAGRHIYAVGGNELASRYSGIRVERVKLGVFLVAGLTAGIAALLALAYYGSASSGDGAGYELNVIAAAVVGGASLSGGRGSALGALLGALIIQMIASGIVILDIDQNYSQIIIGSVVIAAVVLDQVQTWLLRRRLIHAD